MNKLIMRLGLLYNTQTILLGYNILTKPETNHNTYLIIHKLQRKGWFSYTSTANHNDFMKGRLHAWFFCHVYLSENNIIYVLTIGHNIRSRAY